MKFYFLKLGFLLGLAARSVAGGESADRARQHLLEGRPELALREVEAGLKASPEDKELLDLEARSLVGVGDYPAAEEALDTLLRLIPAEAAPERAWRLSQLAEVRGLEGAYERALKDIDRAIALSPSSPVRRAAVSTCLRAQRFREALPHIEALLAEKPDDPFLRFARGIVRSKTGRFEEALGDLRYGINGSGAERDARLESALCLSKLERSREALRWLREILEEDPYDAEACYQASRQLLLLRSKSSLRLSAQLMLYFEALREAEGASSRDQHLFFAGKPAEGALERAAKWERLGSYERALAEAARAEARRPALVKEFLVSFWLRHGLLAEAARLGGESKSPSASLARDGSLEPAGRKVASVLWADAELALGELLKAAVEHGAEGTATEAARLLLAREPRSIPALACLVSRTKDPSLLIPHLHFLKRIVSAAGAGSSFARELSAVRQALEGGEEAPAEK
jgi:tetratricopeptide (TPR) repeat protein